MSNDDLLILKLAMIGALVTTIGDFITFLSTYYGYRIAQIEFNDGQVNLNSQNSSSTE